MGTWATSNLRFFVYFIPLDDAPSNCKQIHRLSVAEISSCHCSRTPNVLPLTSIDGANLTDTAGQSHSLPRGGNV